jgi:hypothetical protein
MMLSGTLSSAATSVVKGGSDSRPAASPDAATSSGAISVGGQSDLGHTTASPLIGDRWWQLANAGILAVVMTQIAS